MNYYVVVAQEDVSVTRHEEVVIFWPFRLWCSNSSVQYSREFKKWHRKTLDLGGKGGKPSGATKMRPMRTEKLSRNWPSRKSKWCLVQATKVGKKLSRNRRRGEDYLHSMVPLRLSFSPMRGISNRLITLLGPIKMCVECVLNVCWVCVECVLIVCWMCVECVLNVCWKCHDLTW